MFYKQIRHNNGFHSEATKRKIDITIEGPAGMTLHYHH